MRLTLLILLTPRASGQWYPLFVNTSYVHRYSIEIGFSPSQSNKSNSVFNSTAYQIFVRELKTPCSL
jgi:hypothetical protein